MSFQPLVSKQPNTIEINQIVMEELICQAESLHNIRTGKKCETVRQKVFVPDIPEEYYSLKDYANAQEQATGRNTKNSEPIQNCEAIQHCEPFQDRSRIADVNEMPSSPRTPL